MFHARAAKSQWNFQLTGSLVLACSPLMLLTVATKSLPSMSGSVPLGNEKYSSSADTVMPYCVSTSRIFDEPGFSLGAFSACGGKS